MPKNEDMIKKVTLIIFFTFTLRAHALVSKAECTDIDIRDNMNEQMKEYFSTPRNQGLIGWCYAFAISDLISAQIKRPVSAMHIAAMWNQKVENNPFMRLSWELNRSSKSTLQKFYQGAYTAQALKHISKQNKICSEKDFPFDPTNLKIRSTIYDFKKLEKIKKTLDESPNLGYQDVKHELEKLTLLADIMDPQLINILKGDDLNNAFAKIALKKCENKELTLQEFKPKKIKAPNTLRYTGKAWERNLAKQKNTKNFFKIINSLLNAHQPMILTYPLNKVLAQENVPHTNTVIARKWFKNKCQYKVRNTFGASCNLYHQNVITDCNRDEGAFWISDEALLQIAKSINYISN